MTSILMQPASQFSEEQLADAFNAGYAGYVMPIHVDAGFIRSHVQTHDIDLNASCLALSDGVVAGIGLLGLRQGRAWVGGIGVDTAFRRQGLGKHMMTHLIEAARDAGVAQVWLEVIESNTAAHNLYLSLGMRDVRQLLVIDRAAGQTAVHEAQGYQIVALPFKEALDQIAAHRSVPSPWQRQAESLQRTADIRGWAALKDGIPVAWSAGTVGSESIRWLDIGGAADGMGALIAYFHLSHPHAVGRLVNLAFDDPAWPLFEAAGYTVRLTQQEMMIEIGN